MLTRRQSALLGFVADYTKRAGFAPSYEEMTEAAKLTKSGVHRLVSALVERGFLSRLPGRARALTVLRLPGDAVPIVDADPRLERAVQALRLIERCSVDQQSRETARLAIREAEGADVARARLRMPRG